MLRVFQNEILDPRRFVVTLELVPGRESTGRSIDLVKSIAAAAFADGRISAVSITDNPGGNPALSPDALGYEIFRLGMDVIVHFTCRDMNRVGMESRALQLGRLGMKTILGLTGDYAGRGFGGQGAPVFDLDAVSLQAMLTMLSERMAAAGDPDGFFAGCAVSPFKWTRAEAYVQYAKLCRKIAAGARFVITQLGYDGRKFQELIQLQQRSGMERPTLGSVYLLTPRTARLMHAGRVPGAHVSQQLLATVEREWLDKAAGRAAAVERGARLAAVLKGLGYRGIHIGGVHRDFEAVSRLLDRLEQIEGRWREFLPEFDHPGPGGFYAFTLAGTSPPQSADERIGMAERLHYRLLDAVHRRLFTHDGPLAPRLHALCRVLDSHAAGRLLVHVAEDPAKKIMLGCRRCGDCAIQHVGYLCPESGCPKHTRNGACGGSRQGRCEVRPERFCVWYRAYGRLAAAHAVGSLADGCVPPRLWELDGTSSWLNFHLRRDHQIASQGLARFCSACTCRLDPALAQPPEEPPEAPP
jgi:methylenetetrahydrofolate reductase (NADPH)